MSVIYPSTRAFSMSVTLQDSTTKEQEMITCMLLTQSQETIFNKVMSDNSFTTKSLRRTISETPEIDFTKENCFTRSARHYKTQSKIVHSSNKSYVMDIQQDKTLSMLINQSDIIDEKAIYFSVVQKHADYIISLAEINEITAQSLTKSSMPALLSRKDKRRLDFVVFANYHKVLRYKNTKNNITCPDTTHTNFLKAEQIFVRLSHIYNKNKFSQVFKDIQAYLNWYIHPMQNNIIYCDENLIYLEHAQNLTVVAGFLARRLHEETSCDSRLYNMCRREVRDIALHTALTRCNSNKLSKMMPRMLRVQNQEEIISHEIVADIMSMASALAKAPVTGCKCSFFQMLVLMQAQGCHFNEAQSDRVSELLCNVECDTEDCPYAIIIGFVIAAIQEDEPTVEHQDNTQLTNTLNRLSKDNTYIVFDVFVDVRENHNMTIDSRRQFVRALTTSNSMRIEALIQETKQYNQSVARLGLTIKKNNIVNNWLMNYRLIETFNQLSVIFSIFLLSCSAEYGIIKGVTSEYSIYAMNVLKIVTLIVNSIYFVLNRRKIILMHMLANIVSFFVWYIQIFELLFMSQVISFMSGMMKSVRNKAPIILFSYIYSVTIMYVFSWAVYQIFEKELQCNGMYDCFFLILNFNKTSNGGLSETLFVGDMPSNSSTLLLDLIYFVLINSTFVNVFLGFVLQVFQDSTDKMQQRREMTQGKCFACGKETKNCTMCHNASDLFQLLVQ